MKMTCEANEEEKQALTKAEHKPEQQNDSSFWRDAKYDDDKHESER